MKYAAQGSVAIRPLKRFSNWTPGTWGFSLRRYLVTPLSV